MISRNLMLIRWALALLLVFSSTAIAQDPAECQGDALVEGYIAQIIHNGEGRVYAVGTRGVYSSCDDGTTWIGGNSGEWALSILVDPQDNSRVIIGTDVNFLGRSLGDLPEPAWSLAAKADSTLLAGGNTGVYESSDGGSHWSFLEGSQVDWRITALLVDPVDDNIIYAGLYAGMALRSLDGGATWQGINDLRSGVSDFEVDPLNPSVFYAASHEGILQSADAGASWIRLDRSKVEDIAFDPGIPTMAYSVSTVDGIAKSIDGGQTWILTNNDFGAAVEDVRSVHVLPSGRVLIGTNSAGIYFSDDGGTSWVLSVPVVAPEPPPVEEPPARTAKLVITLDYKNNNNNTITAGNDAGFRITVRNDGPDMSTGTSVSFAWYEEGAFGDLNPGYTASTNNGACCEFGALARGESITIEFSGKTNKGNTRTYWLHVYADNEETANTVEVMTSVSVKTQTTCLVFICQTSAKSGGGATGLPMLLILLGAGLARRHTRKCVSPDRPLWVISGPIPSF